MSTTNYSVTLKALRQAGACYTSYNRVVRALQAKDFSSADAERKSYIRYVHNENISLQFILDSNGLDDALWTLCCVDNVERDIRLYAVWCARQVQHHMTDCRSIAALDVAERCANGQATYEELVAAEDAARAAARAAAWNSARAVWNAARAAESAAWSAARAAAGGAAWNSARAAAWNSARAAAWNSARAAESAAWSAAWEAAGGAARAAQKDMLVLMINGKAPW